ncbi:MAG: hypothetical protein FWG04_02585 [Desulfovibrionaceae bacterium]|nr:hypothetical protein [Desulfovibrionaceae bacterium]
MSAQNGHEEGLQWLRACSLAVVDKSGKGLSLSELRIVFKISKGETETPNSAEIRVYNLSEATMSRMRREFTRVILQAGYQSNYGIIFDGNIRQTLQGRENGTDTYLDIIAADGDKAYNFAIANATLAAGSTPADRVNACQQAFAAKGAGEGHVPDLGGARLPRGKVMYGMARKYMRSEAESSDCSWSFQDGKMQMVKNDGYLPGEAVVLTHETGLVGTPEQTSDGITVRCLLNPKLRIGGRIKLDNKSIKQAKTDLKASSKQPPKMDNDGFYRILKGELTGDTRGTDWYANMVCIGLDDTSGLPLDKVK